MIWDLYEDLKQYKEHRHKNYAWPLKIVLMDYLVVKRKV